MNRRIHPTRRYRQGPARPAAQPQITLTDEAREVLRLFEEAREPVFLTGRAGTGKSTLLQCFRATTAKKLAVLAPTGVAAVHVQGQTIHSFFGFGPDITIEKVQKMRVRDAALYRKLDALVIDEVSMVRADLLDYIDAFLRLHGRERSRPFGGVQIILIGDLYQLPPVVTPDDRDIFRTYYPSPYFFDAHAWRDVALKVVELTQVWRQRDPTFVSILDAIRTSSLGSDGLARLNSRFSAAPVIGGDDAVMHLVPTNAQAEAINASHLDRLAGQAVTFLGTVQGEFRSASLPTAETLVLKPDAKIMLVANDGDGRWINGDVGVITDINASQSQAAITVALENGYAGTIAPYTWEVVRFTYDAQHDRIEAEVVGSFTQYPLRLAWALTIHKAQGKTFDHVLVDFGRGTFAHGQAYVALSRCTSLEGLVLRQRVERRHILIDPRVQQFFAAARDGAWVVVSTLA